MGKVINHRKFTEISITTQFTHRFEYLSKLDGMKPDLLLKTRKCDFYQDDDLLVVVDDTNDFTDKYYINNGQAIDTDIRYD